MERKSNKRPKLAIETVGKITKASRMEYFIQEAITNLLGRYSNFYKMHLFNFELREMIN